ncbi:hypothetical protein ANCDUO_22609 [Ancylostoma duodenale]|uniref:Uncharacterized protein n=1 Tax=Ancylostoma duodenale TaxID=51022 RepID=A0A0C2FQZ0_9BILA|nr:hypothetical protein ANCDUO_22609 [Ancylostoma duodenale]
MIRHLRSCHVQEYQQVQEARQSTLILKMGLTQPPVVPRPDLHLFHNGFSSRRTTKLRNVSGSRRVGGVDDF